MNCLKTFISQEYTYNIINSILYTPEIGNTGRYLSILGLFQLVTVNISSHAFMNILVVSGVLQC